MITQKEDKFIEEFMKKKKIREGQGFYFLFMELLADYKKEFKK